MTETLRQMIANLDREQAAHLALAAAEAIQISAKQRMPSAAVLTFYLLAVEVSRQHGTPTPDFSVCLASCDAHGLGLLLATSAALSRPEGSPLSAAIHDIFGELRLLAEQARIMGGHTLDRDRERQIEAVLDGGVC